MTVAELTEKFTRLESQIAQEKGDFTLFALFMREDVPDRWDLIVSAPWLGDDKRAAVSYLVDQIKSKLGERDLTNLSRIDRKSTRLNSSHLVISYAVFCLKKKKK